MNNKKDKKRTVENFAKLLESISTLIKEAEKTYPFYHEFKFELFGDGSGVVVSYTVMHNKIAYEWNDEIELCQLINKLNFTQ